MKLLYFYFCLHLLIVAFALWLNNFSFHFIIILNVLQACPIHHYSPLDSPPTPSRWFRDTMKATPMDKPVTRVLQVRARHSQRHWFTRAVSHLQKMPRHHPKQETPAQRVLSLMNLSLPLVQSQSVLSGGGDKRKGTQPPDLVTTTLHTPGRAGQRKGAQHSGLTTILHTPSRAKFF